MCNCNLPDGLHWWVDITAPIMYQMASTPEEAGYKLKSWAAKILRNGHYHLDLIPTAARVLSTKVLNMQCICSSSLLYDSFNSMV